MSDISQYREFLFQFMVNSPFFEDQEHFFKEINEFMHQKFSSGSLEVYTIFPNKAANKNSKRKIWSSKKRFYRFKYLDKLDLKKLKKDFFIVEKDSTSFLFGEEKGHLKVGLVKGKGLVGCRDFLQDYCTYLRSEYNNALKVEKIKKEVALVDIDDVTGLYNSRRLHKDLEEGRRKYQETGEIFSLLFIDIDHFKNVNDGHGHLIGTELLSELAKELRKILRMYDHLYRYGGDEFVILLPKADSQNAKLIGNRILHAVKKKDFSPKKGEKKFIFFPSLK